MTDGTIPGRAVTPDAASVTDASAGLLRGLSLLPAKGADGKVETATVFQTPDSVAVIQSGMTTAAKAWTALIAGGTTTLTAALGVFWEKTLGPANQPFAVVALGFAVGMASLGIAYIIGSDVRGRASGSTATIQARSAVAQAMLTEAARVYVPETAATAQHSYFTVARVDGVTCLRGQDSSGWTVVAGRQLEDAVEYLLVKGSASGWYGADEVRFP